MKTEVLYALLSAGGTVVSALISYVVSRFTANKEIEKMKLVWNHEDIVSSDDEFAEMSAAVAKFVHTEHFSAQVDAMAKVAAIRSKETGAIARCLDDLYFAVQSGNVGNSDVSLSKVIDEKRYAKEKANASRRNKPKK